jgi:hypothetical protein
MNPVCLQESNKIKSQQENKTYTFSNLKSYLSAVKNHRILLLLSTAKDKSLLHPHPTHPPLPVPLVNALPVPLVNALPVPLVNALPVPLVNALPAEVVRRDAVHAIHTTPKNTPPALGLAVPPIEATITTVLHQVDILIPCTTAIMVANK